jgi:hypothetical protein
MQVKMYDFCMHCVDDVGNNCRFNCESNLLCKLCGCWMFQSLFVGCLCRCKTIFLHVHGLLKLRFNLCTRCLLVSMFEV